MYWNRTYAALAGALAVVGALIYVIAGSTERAESPTRVDSPSPSSPAIRATSPLPEEEDQLECEPGDRSIEPEIGWWDESARGVVKAIVEELLAGSKISRGQLSGPVASFDSGRKLDRFMVISETGPIARFDVSSTIHSGSTIRTLKAAELCLGAARWYGDTGEEGPILAETVLGDWVTVGLDGEVKSVLDVGDVGTPFRLSGDSLWLEETEYYPPRVTRVFERSLTSGETSLVATVTGYGPSLAPDERSLAFILSGESAPVGGLGVLDLEEGDAKEWTFDLQGDESAPLESNFCWQPSWDPTSRFLAGGRCSEGFSDSWVIDTNMPGPIQYHIEGDPGFPVLGARRVALIESCCLPWADLMVNRVVASPIGSKDVIFQYDFDVLVSRMDFDPSGLKLVGSQWLGTYVTKSDSASMSDAITGMGRLVFIDSSGEVSMAGRGYRAVYWD